MPCKGNNLVVKVHYGNNRRRNPKPLAKSKGVAVMQGLKEAGGKITGTCTRYYI